MLCGSRRRFVASVALLMFFFGACGGDEGSVVAPSPNGSGSLVVIPLGAMELEPVPLPGSTKPLLYWVYNLDPPDGGQMTMGGQASASLGCGSEATESFVGFIGSGFIEEGKPELDPQRVGGTQVNTGIKCVGGRGTRWINVGPTTRNVVGMKFFFWFSRGSDFSVIRDRMGGPPDAVREVRFSWKAP